MHELDASGSEGRDPLDDYEKINLELTKFSERLAALPQVVAANKMDLPDAEAQLARLKAALEPRGVRVFPVSAATAQGFDALLDHVVQVLSALPPVLAYPEQTLETGPQYEKGFHIERDDTGAYVVSGGDVDRLLDTTDPNDETSMRRFQQYLIRTGIIAALREMGVQEGDTICMGEWSFDFVD